MKINNFLIGFVTFSFSVCFLCLKPVQYFATDGGQVGHEAVIEFYLDEQSEETTDSTSKEVIHSETSSKLATNKPVGRYPQTGEVVKKSLTLSGGILVFSAVFIYVKRHLKERKGENKL